MLKLLAPCQVLECQPEANPLDSYSHIARTRQHSVAGSRHGFLSPLVLTQQPLAALQQLSVDCLGSIAVFAHEVHHGPHRPMLSSRLRIRINEVAL